jgi:hypothetical protein
LIEEDQMDKKVLLIETAPALFTLFISETVNEVFANDNSDLARL